MNEDLSEFAPAKINLCLHVTGQRDDGYHLLDTLVAFVDVGDRLWVEDGNGISLKVTGPQAAGLAVEQAEGHDNLVLKAARLLAETVGVDTASRGVKITLEKNLPVSSGVGGGSADAAAALRLLSRQWGVAPSVAAQVAPQLGADVPMCLVSQSLRATGIGETIQPVPLPPLHMVLVNPGVAVSTPEIFGRLHHRDSLPLTLPDQFSDTDQVVSFLSATTNDLAHPAIEAQPVIQNVLDALSACDGSRLVRMSGSGATCFALFSDRGQAVAASAELADRHPGWWVEAASAI
ncbi:MAG: 4-(cytidine 5'-diphospho)-2-C-methyl-D-erythritol kinase [Pseudomonadota bacterium]